jgi:hypothetical protein
MKTEIIELTQLAARKRSSFGEFLVQHQILNRLQLFRVLQMQDRVPGARLGACAVALGYAPRTTIEQLHDTFARGSHPDLETMTTEAFERTDFDVDVDVVFS